MTHCCKPICCPITTVTGPTGPRGPPGPGITPLISEECFCAGRMRQAMALLQQAVNECRVTFPGANLVVIVESKGTIFLGTFGEANNEVLVINNFIIVVDPQTVNFAAFTVGELNFDYCDIESVQISPPVPTAPGTPFAASTPFFACVTNRYRELFATISEIPVPVAGCGCEQAIRNRLLAQEPNPNQVINLYMTAYNQIMARNIANFTIRQGIVQFPGFCQGLYTVNLCQVAAVSFEIPPILPPCAAGGIFAP